MLNFYICRHCGNIVTKVEDKVINSMIPVWQKKKSEKADEEAKEFYKSKFHDFEDPLSIVRVNAEGITIILVTHSDEIANYAKRVIRVSDGLVVDGGFK